MGPKGKKNSKNSTAEVLIENPKATQKVSELKGLRIEVKVFQKSYDKCLQALKDEMETPSASSVIEEAYGAYTVSKDRLLQCKEKMREVFLELDDEDEVENCLEECVDINQESAKLEVKIRNLYRNSRQEENGSIMSNDAGGEKHRRKLPQLELPIFSGDVREWLAFWSQFEEIDKDDTIPPADKFQYLVQSTLEGSDARKIVKSYPISAENYKLALDNLKERYGRNDVLVKVYVRDLLKLVIENAQQKEKANFSSLYVKLSAKIRALGTLGVTTDACASIIYPVVESCLPEEILRAWQRDSSSKEAIDGKDELNNLMDFLKKEVRGEDNIRLACGGLTTNYDRTEVQRDRNKSSTRGSKKNGSSIATAADLLATDNSPGKKIMKCLFCEKNHPTEKCGKASTMTLEEKQKILQQTKACFSCMKIGHSSKKCRGFVKCLFCSNRHQTIMCPNAPHHQRKSTQKKDVPEEKLDSSSSEAPSMANQVKTNEVLLQTLLIRVHGTKGSVTVKALIDTGSSKSYVLKEVAEKVGLRKIGEETVIHGLFGGIESKPQLHSRYLLQASDVSDQYFCQFEVSDSNKISADIRPNPEGPWLEELKKQNILITDVESEPKSVDVLIGADVAGKLTTGKKIELSHGPVAVETRLGWTLMGKLSISTARTITCLNSEVIPTSHNFETLVSIEGNAIETVFANALHVQDLDISKMWTLDSIGITEDEERKTASELDKQTMEKFLATLKKTDGGRYEVKLLWKDNHPPISSNKWIAIKRLQSTTTKLKSQGTLQAYDALFKSWETNGMIEEVKDNEVSNYGHYLPHRAVYNPSSKTTPIRPVFDASCRMKGHPSLNDCLETGPNLLEQIPSIITRFRLNKVGVLADIKKAFQQISVSESDRDMLRFIWWTSQSCEKLKTYRHSRVVFGVNSSPFILAATLKHLLDSVDVKWSNTADILRKSLYVDNVVAAVNGKLEASQFKNEANQIMKTAQFELREWEIGPTKEEKFAALLGLQWNMKTDMISFDLSALTKMEFTSVTKRKILAAAHSIFDPLGFACPFTIVPKLLLQDAWKLKTGWDTEVPDEMKNRFLSWLKQVKLLDNLHIRRWITTANVNRENWNLHVFVDASQTTYATCIFLRVEGKNSVFTELVMAKARVAPLKNLSIPRLELMACLIGSRLSTQVKEMLEYPDIDTTFWSDSTTALHWIKSTRSWGPFVQNRVKEIRTIKNAENWRFVPGEQNPADLPSRGCNVDKLIQSNWTAGPDWLKKTEREWPESIIQYEENEVTKELKKSDFMFLNRNEELEFINQLTSYEEMVFEAAKSIVPIKQKSDVSVGILKQAEKYLLKKVQSQAFKGTSDEKLKKFNVMIDQDGLVKMKTRLQNGSFEDSFKNPVILPPESPVVAALIMKIHLENSHGGIQFMLNKMREEYWILNGRRTIRKVLKKCLECQRFSVKKMNAATPSLPVDRIQAEVPFEVTGVDLTGPLHLNDGRKGWIVLFSCAVYRAIHMELVTSLSTDGFLLALRRFVNRRGRPKIMYSDNGTNLVGCRNNFKKVSWKNVELDPQCRSIIWKLNPPTACWWGGWYERMIGLVKQCLRRVLGNASMSYEELETVLIDVEATVNQRPLTYVSQDPEDLVPLSPSLFLTGNQSSNIPEADYVDGNGLNRRWKIMQRKRDDLRSRFRKEYLGQLVSSRQRNEKRVVKVGDTVIVGQDNKKRIDWPLGKIIEVLPSPDGVIRRVNVQTATGVLLRPIQRIYPLEVEDSKPKELRGNQNFTGEGGSGIVTKAGRVVKLPERLTYISI